MAAEDETGNKVAGGAGITAGRDVTVGDVSGQAAIGEFINQFMIEKPSGEALVKLMDYLDKKRQDTFNKEILSKYAPSELPDYQPKLREFVTTNRADELTKALIYLHDHRILLISGIGGVGKTTLARALVETRPANVPPPFWFDFRENMDATLGDVLEKLAGYMKVTDIAWFKREKRDAGKEDINRLMGELKKQIWLIFDNLETALDGTEFHDPGMDMLFTSLRGSSHNAKIILTSRTLPTLRNTECLIDAIEGEKKELKGLSLDFAVDYLKKNGLDEIEQKKLEDLAKGVEGHPLALKLLLELVKKFGIKYTLNDLSMYQKRKEDIIKKARRLFDKLAGDEKELLERVSVFRKPESLDAIKSMFTDGTSGDAIDKLLDKSLLETDHRGAYWLHPLVREFAYNDLKDNAEVHKRAYEYYLSVPLPEKRIKKEDVQTLIEAHHHACLAHDYDKAAEIIFSHKLNIYLTRWGNYKLLIELLSRVLPKDHFKNKILLTGRTTHDSVLQELGNATIGYINKLSAYRIHGYVLHELGNTYYAMGQLERAKLYHEQFLNIARAFFDSRGEGAALGNLGNFYDNVGEVEKAIEYHKQALEIARKIEDKGMEGNNLGNLGIVYMKLGKVDKAIEYCEQALQIARETADREEEAHGLGNLGSIYYDLGKKEAIEYYEKAIEIAYEIGDLPHAMNWLGNMGNIYNREGLLETGIKYYEMGLKIARKIEDSFGECLLLGNLGRAYNNLGQVDKAIEYYDQALVIAREMGDRRSEGAWLGKLGIIYSALGQVDKAIGYYEQALVIAREIGDRKGEGAWLGNLGLTYQILGQVDKAIGYYGQALVITREMGDRRSEGNHLNNLAFAFIDENKYREALACHLLARGIRIEIKDPNIKTTESNLIVLKDKLGEKEFEKLLAEVAPRAEDIIMKILEESLKKN